MDMFTGIYGDQKGLIRCLFSTEPDEKEQEEYENCSKLLDSLTICQQHNKPVTCVCLEPSCPQKGIVCLDCMMDFHKPHFMKVFKIEKVVDLIQKNSTILKEIANDDGRSLRKVVEEDTLPVLIKEFNFELEILLNSFFDKIQHQESKIEDFYKIKNENDARKVINQRLIFIGSLIRYNDDSTMRGLTDLKGSKTNLQQKLDFLREYLKIRMDAFRNNMEAAIEIALKMTPGMTFERFGEKVEKVEKHRPESAEEEEEKEEKKEEKIEKKSSMKEQAMLDEKLMSLSLQQNFVKRLPHLPQRTEIYWPITCQKKEKIRFRPLRDRVALLGFTQLKIMSFEEDVAKFKVSLFAAPTDQFEDEEGIIYKIKKPKYVVVHTQEMHIRPEENEESNFILFNRQIVLKEDYVYKLKLTAVKSYGCTSKYGLNNQEGAPSNEVLEFLARAKEFEKSKCQPYKEFTTTSSQGVFPSLIYEILKEDQGYNLIC